MSVSFHELKKVKLSKRSALKSFIPTIFLIEAKLFESLNIIFCSDEYLLDMNRQYLNHDFYTDIITFDLSESKKSAIVGDLYISIDRVKENSVTNDINFNHELHRVIFHGVLHLCGFKDKSKKEIVEMRIKESEYLTKYGLK
jgi:probable rRNA maturation factor